MHACTSSEWCKEEWILRGLPGAVSEGNIDGDDVTLGQERVQAVLPMHAHVVKAVGLLMAVKVQPLDIPCLQTHHFILSNGLPC